MKSIIETIKERVSIRTYNGRPLEQEKKDIILNLLSSNNIGPFGHQSRFQLVDFTELDREEIRKLGTYGFIKGANLFIVGITKLEEKSLEDFGYCLEKIILEITKLELGTCWIVGSFKRSNFAQKVETKEGETVVGITPVGYSHEKRTLTDKFIRFTARSHKRKQWDELFFENNMKTPLQKEAAGKYAVALESVRLAPSGSNIQPWRIIKEADQNVYHFYYQGAKGYMDGSQEFKLAYIQNINIGIAMCHFELSAIETGLTGRWDIVDPQREYDNMTYVASWVDKTK